MTVGQVEWGEKRGSTDPSLGGSTYRSEIRVQPDSGVDEGSHLDRAARHGTGGAGHEADRLVEVAGLDDREAHEGSHSVREGLGCRPDIAVPCPHHRGRTEDRDECASAPQHIVLCQQLGAALVGQRVPVRLVSLGEAQEFHGQVLCSKALRSSQFGPSIGRDLIAISNYVLGKPDPKR